MEVLSTARNICILTGAGVSAESGVPTFRDAQTGIWAQFRAEDLATPEAFARDPVRVWEWYGWRRSLIGQVEPNPAHRALAEWQSAFPGEWTLITQNVDGLHQRAGSAEVIELHGNILRTKCSSEDRVVEAWPETDEVPPCCPHCGAFLRPDVVWFGEMLPVDALGLAAEKSGSCDVFVCIGTSGLVYPAAGLPSHAKAMGAFLIEINPDPTPLSDLADTCLRGKAGLVLPELLASLRSAQKQP